MKKLMIKHGEFTNRNGEVKNKWVEVGVIMSNDKGEYALLDPAVNLAAFKEQGKDKVIASIFEDRKSQEDSSDVPFN